MSTTGVVTPAPSARSRWRRLRWVLLAALALLAGGAGLYAYLAYSGERELQDAIAEADRLDPGWRFDEMEAARAIVPDAENSALVVLAARALMPAKWMAPPANGDPSLEDRLAELAPVERPNAADLAELYAEMARAAPALDRARQLAELPRGRYKVPWTEDLIGTLIPHAQEPRVVVRMLVLDALLRAREGDAAGAMRSCRAALNGGRSLGDEPIAVSQFVRATCALETVRALERTLAHVTADARSLETMQHALAAEAEAPLLLIAIRAERVSYFQSLDLMRTGRFNWASYKVMPSRLGPTVDDWIARGQARGCEAAYLRYTTALVEIARQPAHLQTEKFDQLARPHQPLPGLLAGLTNGSSDWAKRARIYHRSQAALRYAAAALAAERYRLAEGRWPERLAALVPRYLVQVPIDLYDGRPLRLRRLPDGLLVYSVGPDRTDDGGRLDRKQPDEPGSDLGFQLWDSERRLSRGEAAP
jgi:hypothetical protein